MLKRPYISLIIGSRASKYENNLPEIIVCECFANLTFVPVSRSSGGHHTKTAIYLLYIGPLA